LVVRKKQVADVKAALIAGKPTCEGKPIPLTGAILYHWHKALSLLFNFTAPHRGAFY
jgi:hypothetical protein